MGGFGSGYWGSRRATVEEMKRIDLAWLRSKGILNAGIPTTLHWSCGGEEIGTIGIRPQSNGLRLKYRTRPDEGEWHTIDELVPFVWTPTQFGGMRQWFTCLACARKCRILYGGARFRCRRCYRLRYASQAETRADRATRGMFKIVRRLDPDTRYNDLPPKPKGMHWCTYERLAERYEAYGCQWSIEAMRRFGIRL
jgi:hypothetical protein